MSAHVLCEPPKSFQAICLSPVWKKKGGFGAPPVISHTNSVDSFGNSAGWSGVDSCRCVQRRQHGGGDDAVARRPSGGGEGSCAPPTGSADSYACRRGAAIRCFSAPQKPDPVLCFRACAAVPVDAPPPPPPRARSAQRAVRIRTAVWVSWLPDLLSRVRVVFADGAQERARTERASGLFVWLFSRPSISLRRTARC